MATIDRGDVPMAPRREGLNEAPSRAYPLLFLGVLLIAIVLRFFEIGEESLWLDEAYSVRDAVAITAVNRSRPLYYLILRFWMQFGQDEAWLRVPAAVFGVLAVALLYPVARRLADERAALIACLLMAVCATELDHSQEVRMYTLASCLTLGNIWMLLRWYDTGQRRFLAGQAVLGILMMMTTPALLLPLLLAGALALLAAVRARRAVPPLILSYALLFATWSPLALAARRTMAHVETENIWVPPVSASKLVTLPFTILTGNLSLMGNGIRDRLLLGAFIFLLLALIGLAFANPGRLPALRVARPAAAWFYGTAVLVFLYSLVRVPLWVPRYFQPVAPALYLLLALGLLALARLAKPAAWLAAMFLFGVLLHTARIYYVATVRPDARGLVRWVDKHAHEGDVVCVASRYEIMELWRFYYHGQGQLAHLRLPASRPEGPTVQDILAACDRVPAHTGRTWVVTQDARLHSALFQQEMSKRLRSPFVGIREWQDVLMLEFARPASIRDPRDVRGRRAIR